MMLPVNITVCGKEVRLNLLRMMHDGHGPRSAYMWLTGKLPGEFTTTDVEDFAIEYYTKYNALVPNTY